MKPIKIKPRPRRYMPRSLYDALPYVYACIGIGLLYGLGSGVSFVLGVVLLVAAALVSYMRSSARERAYRKWLEQNQRREWD
ncbi:MAG: hypothetical protein V7752_05670 [Halopseudomonas sp.]